MTTVEDRTLQAERSKDVVRRFFEACNRHDLDEIMSFFHRDVVHHSRLSDYPKEGIAFAYRVTLQAFPDLKWNVLEMTAEGDRVATLVRFEATHSGDYLGTAATGRPVRFLCADFGRIQDGQFIEHRGVLDELHLVAQIGIVPETFLAQMS
jgi:predicted ester cyclase